VYLEQRTPQDLVRNGLVSVFLRVMEYCQGIMFLTTNRVSQFDPAALSRIHLKLKYDDLDINARRQVWKNLLDRAGTSEEPVNISTDVLESLSKTLLNGREVRSLTTTHNDMITDQETDQEHSLNSSQVSLLPKEQGLFLTPPTSCSREQGIYGRIQWH